MPKIISTGNGVVLDVSPYVSDVTKLGGGKFARLVSDATAAAHIKEISNQQEIDALNLAQQMAEEDKALEAAEGEGVENEESRASKRKERRGGKEGNESEGVEVI